MCPHQSISGQKKYIYIFYKEKLPRFTSIPFNFQSPTLFVRCKNQPEWENKKRRAVEMEADIQELLTQRIYLLSSSHHYKILFSPLFS